MRISSSSTLILGTLMLLAAGSSLETNTASAQEFKIAVVDLNLAMNEVDEGKKAIESLEKRVNNRRTELEKRGVQIQEMKDDLERKSMVMSDEAKKSRAQEIQEKMMALQQAQYEAEQEMQGLRNQLQMGLADKLRAVCEDIAKKEGYTLVIEKQVIWYSLPQYDMTDKLIEAYNTRAKAAK